MLILTKRLTESYLTPRRKKDDSLVEFSPIEVLDIPDVETPSREIEPDTE